MRIIQLLGLVITIAVGTWARLYHRQIMRELHVESGTQQPDSFQQFEDAFFKMGSETNEKPTYGVRSPATPSEVQSNPFVD